MKHPILIILSAALFCSRPSAGQPQSGPPASELLDHYDSLNIFSREHFSAEKESMMYETFGDTLRFLPDGEWNWVSAYSACVAFETNLPALATVRFGPSDRYGDSTDYEERYFFLHAHYLRNLQPRTTYHYRLEARNERGDVVLSADRTFTTSDPSGAVRVPDDLTGDPPYLLDQSGAYYLVTTDITAPSTAFNIAASGITLDLGGHTILYDNVRGAPDPIPPGDWSWYATQGPCGIRQRAYTSTRIVNGRIRQGAGNGDSDPAGFNPLFLRRPRDTEVAGCTIEYYGGQISGFIIDSGHEGLDIHHNTVIDRGWKIDDRHQGVDGIFLDVEGGSDVKQIHHNRIKRTRHRGIHVMSGTDCRSNEIYVDSWATNSYGIMYYSSSNYISAITISRNRIFGTGYHPIGIGAGYKARNIRVTGNYIQMQGQAPSAYRWPGGPGDPTGQEHPVNGIRLQKGSQYDVEYSDNVIVTKANGIPEEGVLMRGLWMVGSDTLENVVVRRTRIRQVAENRFADGYAVAALGVDPDDSNTVVSYFDNRIESNLCNIRFGDNYAHGGRHHFVNTTLVRLGSDPRYRTLKFGWMGWRYSSYGHTFLDSRLEGGAGFDSVGWEGAATGRYDFTLKWTLAVRSYPGSDVEILDAQSTRVDHSLVGSDSSARFVLTERVVAPHGSVTSTPHTVRVTYRGMTTIRRVTMDRPRLLEIFDATGSERLPSLPEIPEQNYPNPFTHHTIIPVNHKRSAGRIELKVFDLLGREIVDLSERARSTPSVRLDTGILPGPGIYVYRLTTGSSTFSRRMVYLR